MEQEFKESNIKKPLDYMVLIIIGVFLIQWLFLFRLAGPTWDEAFYYVYARSVVFDQELHLQNDFILSYKTASSDFVAKEYHADLTGEARTANPFAIGTAVLWLPWMATIRFLVEIGQTLGFLSGEWVGFEWPFYGGMGVFSAFCGMFAFILAYRIARAEVSQKSALLATLTLMFATPLLYYQFREPMYSHTMSAFVTTIVVFIWQRQYKSPGKPIQAVFLGAAIGLAGLTRWQNVMYLALPFVSVAFWWFALPLDEKKRAWQRALIYVVLVGGTAVFIFSLQMSVWKLIYNAWITIPQGDAFMDWRAPFIKQVLFSTFHGLLAWMPVFFLSIAGLIAMGRKKAAFVLPLLILLALEIYVNGSTRDWFGAGGFGGRRFTSELAILIVGYAGFLQLWPARIRSGIGGVLGIILTIYNWSLLRYGMSEKIGGHVVSMYPNFEWADERYVEFLTTLAGRASIAFRQPFDFWVFPDAPLSLLLQQHVSSIRPFATLVGTAVFMLFLWFLWQTLWKRLRKTNISDYAFVVLLVLSVIIANLWILFRA